jgi:hypothetical protein
MAKKKYVHVSAVLRYYDFEGGFWGMVDEPGNEWLPVNLPDSWTIQKDIKVLVSFKILKDVVSFVNWGIPVEITDIRTG